MAMIVFEPKITTTGNTGRHATATGSGRLANQAKNSGRGYRVSPSGSSGSNQSWTSNPKGNPSQLNVVAKSSIDRNVLEKAFQVLWRIVEQAKSLGDLTPLPSVTRDGDCMIFSWQVNGRHLEMEFGPDYAFYSKMEVCDGQFIEEDGEVDDSGSIDAQLGWISGKP